MSNGTQTPTTPKHQHANLALTEYTANPSPPNGTPREKTHHAGVPLPFLLPTGYPDVRIQHTREVRHGPMLITNALSISASS